MKYSGIIAAGSICLFAAYLLVSSFSFASEAGTALGPGFMPRMLGIILLVLGAADLAGEIKRKGGQSRRDGAKGRLKKGKSHPASAGQDMKAGQKRTEAGQRQEDIGRAVMEGDPAVTAAVPKIGGWIAGHTDVLSIPLLLAYVYSMKPIGFLFSSMAYMFLHMLLLTAGKKRNYPLLILLALLVPGVIYFCFVKLFYLMLPAGLL